MTDNPRQAETEAALAAFYRRAEAGRVPKQRRYSKIGGVVGAHQHQRRKRRRRKLGW